MKYLFFAVIGLLTLQSCKDIFAPNLSNNTPVLLVVQENDTVLTNPVQFKWEKMEGATKYHLQIVTPSFSNPSNYVFDSIVTGTEIYITLDSAQYEMKLTAMNAGNKPSKTLGPIKFWVDGPATVEPSTALVPLLIPSNNSYVNKTFDGTFTWGAVPGGTNYQFKLVKGTSFVDGTEIHSTALSNTFEATVPDTKLPLDPAFQYFWGVKAYIGSTELLYSTGTFYVDTIKPNEPLLSSPLDLATDSVGLVTFSWDFNATGEQYSSPVHSLIQVGTDSTFTASSITHTSNAVQFTHTFTMIADTYFWRVVNIDEAGNISIVSDTRKLTIVQ